jgi:hypothetical protein
LRRWVKRSDLSGWTEAAWEVVRGPARRKAAWRDVQQRLQKSGRTPAAARKQVQRWKRQGHTPETLLASLAARKVKVPECFACGDPAGRDDQDRTLTYEGAPMCADCWLEKTGG